MTTEKLRLGICGFGGAAGGDIRSAIKSGHFEAVAAADPELRARERFEEQYDAPSCESVDELLSRYELDAVLIATPTRLHEEQTIQALEAGVHVLVEKPIATSVDAALGMIRAVRERNLVLMVNHKRSVDRTIITMWQLVNTGELGKVRAVHRWHFNDWFYRPRGLDERDPDVGGAVLRQGAHEFDIIRLLSSNANATAIRMRGTTGEFDTSKPGEGAYSSWIDYDDNMIATSLFGGYGHFLSEELITGPLDASRSGRSKRALNESVSSGEEEAELKRQSVGSTTRVIDGGVNGVYGYTLVNCENGDMRPSPTGGVWVYDDNGRREVTCTGASGTDLMAEELYRAISDEEMPMHDGAWGLACLELCSSVRQSSALNDAVPLQYQSYGSAGSIGRLLSDHQLVDG